MMATITDEASRQLTPLKKVWLTPELILITGNDVKAKPATSVREATGHASGYTPNDHAAHPGHHFINAPSGGSVLSFYDAAS